MLVSSTLILVVVTTLVFGTFMGKVQSILVPASNEDEEEYIESQRKDSHVMAMAMSKRRASSLFNDSHYEEIIHPNEEGNSSLLDPIIDGMPFHWPTSSFVRWFILFDEHKLRPFFIRKYNRTIALLEDEYQELIKQQFDD